MPTKIDPVVPPRIAPAYEKPTPPIGAWSDPVKQQQAMLAPPPKPDVTAWVVKANARLDVAWQENEIRGGRIFSMSGASEPEIVEVVSIFRKDWDVGMFSDGQALSLIFKPRRSTPVKR